MRLSRYSTIGIMVALLLTVAAIMPAWAAEAGSISTDKSFVSPEGSVKVTVVDADLSVLTAATATETNTWTTGSVVFASLADTNGDSGTLTFGTVAIGDEITGAVTVKSTTVGVLADYIATVLVANTGKISIQFVGSPDPGAGVVLELGYNIATKNTTTVKITSPSDQTGITLTLTETSADSKTFEGTFSVGSGTSAGTTIQAVAPQKVEIKYTDASSDDAKRTASVLVENTKPSGTLIGPTNKSFTTDLTPTLSVDFTDTDSGVDSGTIIFVIDTISGTGTLPYAAGATIAADTEAITGGFRATKTLASFTDAKTTKITWHAKADDKAGNSGVTDADTSKSGDQRYVLTVDKEGPKITTANAFVGRWWDVEEEELVTDAKKAKNTVIAILFADILGTDKEVLDGATFAVADFEIDGLKSVGGAIISDITPIAVNVYDDIKNYAFLTVAAMAPDADPTAITLKGPISDSAGNSTSTGSVATATNRIAPTLAYTLDKTLDDDKVKITITSDEALLGGAPTVLINYGDASVLSSVTGTLIGTLQWEATLNPATGADGVWAVQVSASDVDNNAQTLGNKLSTEDFPTSKSIVFYTDSELPPATLTPADGSSPETAAPFFLTIDHSDEGKEYGLTGATPPQMTHAIDDVVTDLDVSATVTLTAATLDGVDILSQFETQNNLKFTAAITDISNGEHKLVYSAEDEAGNEVKDFKVTFTVKARKAYSVSMNAGWNLISFPGTPFDGAIDSVLPASHPATDVLSFDDGVWSVASRSIDGTWEGTLTTIDEKHGYWVNSPSSQNLEALLSLQSVGAAATLPTISIEAGWNLVSVIDLAQAKQDTTADSADDVGAKLYFTSVDWAVAYTFSSSTRTWTRHTASTVCEGAGTPVCLQNGQGVWVWANKAGTLIP